MPIATRLTAVPYPLAVKHHKFLKQENKNLSDAGIIHKSMSPLASPIFIVKKHTPHDLPQQFCLFIDYRKFNSLLLAVTPAMGTKKGTLTLMPLLKIDGLFALLKETKYFTALDLHSGYYHIQFDAESIR